VIKIFPLVLFFCFSLKIFADDAKIAYQHRDEVKSFAKEMSEKHGFDEKGLLVIFAQAKYKQNIIDAISRPAERVLTWAEYQDIFLTEKRIRDGRSFMLEHKDALIAAEKKYGIPPVIVTAVIGVETMYGRITGSFRVLDALSTLSFDYPPRSKFFRKELEQFLLLAREQKQSILDINGSYAGAMGYGQFIPSSYRAYAVDFDEDGFSDIWHNPTDAIGSVANYFAEHGWRKGDEVVVKADPTSDLDDIVNVSLKPTQTLGDLKKLGVKSSVIAEDSERISPMRLAGKSGDEYWLGFTNFYVITRYNHSKLYAMAVYQLSEALRSAGTLASH